MRSLVKALTASSLLLFTSAATNAQDRPRGDTRYEDRDEYRDHGRLLDRVRSDLDRAEANTLPFTADRIRIERARQELSEFQRAMDAGSYGRRKLGDAVLALQRVLDSNHLSYTNRDTIAEDLNRMRDLQATYDSWR